MQQPRQRKGTISGQASGQAGELRSRGEALRQAAALAEADPRQVLDAVLVELEAAVAALADAESRERAEPKAQDAQSAERRLLQATFQQVPMALFLLGPDGTVRRANAAAAGLLGAGSGYATGKRFTALIDPAARAAVRSRLAAVLRTGEPCELACGLLAADGVLGCELSVRTVSVRGGDDRLLVAVAAGDAGSARAKAPQAADRDPDGVRATMTRRLDLVAAANRLLLENVDSSEAVLLQRMAWLLADHLGSWVLVDMKHSGGLVRHSVAGPDEEESGARAQAAMAVSPLAGSAPFHVAWTESAMLLAHADDDALLGATADGVPLLLLLRGASLLCVPIAAAGASYGTVTLVRSGDAGPFGLADAGLAEEVAEQLARAITAHRMIERRTEAAESLQASLLPRELKQVPGVRFGAAHLPPTLGSEVGGDFYDVYSSPQGWGVAIGDVCGKGRDAAAVTAAARHAIRVLGHWNADPGEVLRAANDIMLAEAFDGRFVTADAAHLSWQDGRLRVVLGSAGHPGPVLITADGRARLIEGGGVPLGVFPDGEVAVVERELWLDPGDVLFFCTDGLTGARSPDLTYFGERLADELSQLAGRDPAELIAELKTRLVTFCDGILLDDVTMLALQAVEPPD